MRRAERVVGALRALGEARQPAALAQGADALAPAGQDLVRIGLMAHIPDHTVSGGIEDIMKGDGEFYNAQPRAKMSACHGYSVNGLMPQFIGELFEF